MTRTHRVNERPVLVVAAIGGIVAALSDASPASKPVSDAVLTFAAIAFASALWTGLQRRDLAVERAVVAAITFNVLVRAQVDPALGVSALVGIGCGVLVVVFGVRRRGRRTIRCVSVAGLAIGGN